MPVYSYSGFTLNGLSSKGTIGADSPRQARERLREQGFVVKQLSESSNSGNLAWLPSLGARRARMQWSTAARELSMLLRAGISPVDALDTLIEQYSGAFRTTAVMVRDKIAAGMSLADALAESPDVFDVASVRLVEVGENAGNLDYVLEQLANYKQRMAALGNKLTTALIYPAFLSCFGLAAAVFLMTVVLPPLLENLTDAVGTLPWPTRVAKSLSDGLVHHGVWWILCSVGSAACAFWAIRRPAGRDWLDRTILKLPLLGNLVIKQNLARIATIIGLLCRSGLPLASSVRLAAASTGNTVIRGTLERACEDLTSGKDLAESLRKSGFFPPLAVRVFSVGQDSGKLDEMLTALGEDYNAELEVASARATAMIEPALILVLALFVGFLLVATVLPILQASNISN